jgi:Divergent InlB B-repeat domain
MQLPFNGTSPPGYGTCTSNSNTSQIVAPWIIPVSYPAGDYMLVYTERQHCAGGSYGTLTLLQGLLFTSSSVISNVANFGNPTLLYITTPTAGAADAGYPALAQTGSDSSHSYLNMSFYQPKCPSCIPGIYSVPLTISSNSSTLTVTLAGAGTGTVMSGDGFINCGTSCTDTVANGTQVTLTATAGASSTFANWINCTSSSGNVCTQTVNSNVTVTATFNVYAPTDVSRGNLVERGNVISR